MLSAPRWLLLLLHFLKLSNFLSLSLSLSPSICLSLSLSLSLSVSQSLSLSVSLSFSFSLSLFRLRSESASVAFLFIYFSVCLPVQKGRGLSNGDRQTDTNSFKDSRTTNMCAPKIREPGIIARRHIPSCCVGDNEKDSVVFFFLLWYAFCLAHETISWSALWCHVSLFTGPRTLFGGALECRWVHVRRLTRGPF